MGAAKQAVSTAERFPAIGLEHPEEIIGMAFRDRVRRCPPVFVFADYCLNAAK